MVQNGKQPAIPIPEKITGDKYYNLNSVKYIAKVIKNFRYGDFAEYRQGKIQDKKFRDKEMVQGDCKGIKNGDSDNG
jgi:hypothetical protein